jgi:hypothetical protein
MGLIVCERRGYYVPIGKCKLFGLKKVRQMDTALDLLYIRCRVGHYYSCVNKFEFNDISLNHLRKTILSGNGPSAYITK